MQPTPEEDAVNSADTKPALGRRHGNGPVFFVIATVFAVFCAFGWGYAVMSYSGLGGGVYHQVVSSSVKSSNEAVISYEVNSKNGAECLIVARDGQLVEVGQARSTAEPGNRLVTTTIDTIRQAAAVEVASCREQGSQD